MSITSVPMIDAATVTRLLDYPSLVEALRRAFLDPPIVPQRHNIAFPQTPTSHAGSLLVMPAVQPGRLIAVKLVTIHPGHAGREGGALRSTYLALDAASGDVRGMIDGHALTVRRTAATSVLAAMQLARPNPDVLLMAGSGEIAHALVDAYAELIKPKLIRIWSRRAGQARRFVGELGARGVGAEPVSDLEKAVPEADIISTATLSQAPLFAGNSVRPGTHIDLVGAFRPEMRESDDDLIARARVVVDVETTLTEAGDIVSPLTAGRIDASDITTLRAVLAGGKSGRSSPHEITVFKSAGHALEDLAAAELVFARATDS
jgi:ornithine cyclodeaminase